MGDRIGHQVREKLRDTRTVAIHGAGDVDLYVHDPFRGGGLKLRQDLTECRLQCRLRIMLDDDRAAVPTAGLVQQVLDQQRHALHGPLHQTDELT